MAISASAAKSNLNTNNFKPSWAQEDDHHDHTDEHQQEDERKGLLQGSTNADYNTDYNTSPNRKKKKKKKKKRSSNDSYSSSSSSSDLESGVPRRSPLLPPLRTPLHNFFLAVQTFTILSSLSLLTSTILTLYYSLPLLTLTQLIVRIYATLFTLCIIVVEMEWLGSNVNNFIARGVIYLYVGVSSDEFLNDGVLDKSYPNKITTFSHITNYVMCSMGVLYFILGVLCCRGKREKRRNEYRERKKKWEDRRKR
eukprot:CAMPEP_0182493348 /NCGR_PEP_ID=MMETSP1321-20130603/2317_1 /TAXON_ID=91990 /ORGANISM="Bolidomonas sp., Strain RCC1657" /LENGTH=252 /DNA_ID=CAMNT_0024696077 /DNA_START=167 /DNA_END=922 /DNA_ORIENTATION=-